MIFSRLFINTRINPMLPISLVLPLDEPFCGSRTWTWQPCTKLYFSEVQIKRAGPLRRHRRSDGKVGDSHLVLGRLQSKSKGPFSDAHIDFAWAITPHIKRAVRISGLLAHGQVTRGTLQGVLSALPAAALIVSAERNIQFANTAAMSELRSGRIIAETRNKLRTGSPQLLEFMSSLLGGAKGHDVLVEDRTGRRLHVTGVRLDTTAESSGAYLLVLRSPEPDLHTPIATAARLYTLTITEVQVLKHIVEGQSLGESGRVPWYRKVDRQDASRCALCQVRREQPCKIGGEDCRADQPGVG